MSNTTTNSAHQYPANYDHTVYVCNVCNDSGIAPVYGPGDSVRTTRCGCGTPPPAWFGKPHPNLSGEALKRAMAEHLRALEDAAWMEAHANDYASLCDAE